MDLPTSAISTGLRVGIQIASNQKRPVVEIYHQVRNLMGPEQEFRVPFGGGVEIEKHRFGDQFITFMAVNIGTLRAENLTFRIEDGLKRRHPREFGELFATTIPHMSSGQALLLFRLDTHELDIHDPQTGALIGITREHLRIVINYDGPWEGLNRVGRFWAKLCRKKQFTFLYSWNPVSVFTDLPEIEYS